MALSENDNLIAEYTVQYKKTHSQTLLPMLQEICRMVELDLDTVDAIAVAAGPGSFTDCGSVPPRRRDLPLP